MTYIVVRKFLILHLILIGIMQIKINTGWKTAIVEEKC